MRFLRCAARACVDEAAGRFDKAAQKLLGAFPRKVAALDMLGQSRARLSDDAYAGVLG